MIRNNQESTIVDVLNSAVQDVPDQVVYHYLDDELDVAQSLTFSSIKSKAMMIASYLASKGIKKGDRVLLIYPPGLEFISAFLGVYMVDLLQSLVTRQRIKIQ